VLGQISIRLAFHVTDASSLVLATTAAISAEIEDIPLNLVAITLVSAIYRRQKALVDQS
jgi:hypothetical protein